MWIHVGAQNGTSRKTVAVIRCGSTYFDSCGSCMIWFRLPFVSLTEPSSHVSSSPIHFAASQNMSFYPGSTNYNKSRSNCSLLTHAYIHAFVHHLETLMYVTLGSPQSSSIPFDCVWQSTLAARATRSYLAGGTLCEYESPHSLVPNRCHVSWLCLLTFDRTACRCTHSPTSHQLLLPSSQPGVIRGFVSLCFQQGSLTGSPPLWSYLVAAQTVGRHLSLRD